MPATLARLVARRSFSLAGALLTLACQREPRRPAYYPTPAPTYTATAPGYPAATPGAPAPAPTYGLPAPAPAPAPAPTAAPTPLPPVTSDPINSVDIGFLRSRAAAVLNELVAALPEPQHGRVQGIPLITDSTVGEVNAFATCTRSGKRAMAITDGLLDIQAHLAQARAADEIFGGRTVDSYVRFIAQNQKPKTPIVQPPPGMFDARQMVDARKVARQHDVLDEQIAFVLGHELAHHYLGHLPCTSTGGINLADIGQVLIDAVPAFNQPNEVAADVQGINNTLTTGARRQGYHFTDGGALLTMQFFSAIDQFSPVDILFGFERSHPPPGVRIPIIQQTASAWASTGGRGLPILSL